MVKKVDGMDDIIEQVGDKSFLKVDGVVYEPTMCDWSKAERVQADKLDDKTVDFGLPDSVEITDVRLFYDHLVRVLKCFKYATQHAVDKKERERIQLVFDSVKEPSLTRQAFKDQCDINNIMKRYSKTGVLDHVKMRSPSYGDYSNVVDYQTALNVVDRAMEAFNALPSDVRTRFSNNPGLFEAFCNDPANRDELIKLGLIDVKPKVDGEA